MNLSFAALALSSLAVLSPSAACDETWYDDFDAAVKAAQDQGKDLLVDFTGSDWCGWCIKLHDEVFQHDVWMKGAQKDYILVALDFPRSDEAKAKVPNPKRNDELQAKYEIRGFPTILLMTADGDVFGQTGYQAGGPEKYLEHMAELRAGREQLFASKRIAAEFDAAADDGARWAVWQKAIEVMESSPAGAPFLKAIEVPVRFAIEADAKNEKGSKARTVLALLKSGMAKDADMDAALELDPKNEAGMLDFVAGARFGVVRDDETARAAVAMLEKVDALGFKDTALAFRLNFQAAMWCAGPLADEAGKLKFAKRAKEIGASDAAEADEGQMKELDKLIG